MPETPISVAIITYNEEANIERCIRSVREIADEIIVLDSGSEDQTASIATSLGAIVHVHVFDGHIQQKNRAITLCKFPHVLSLDADEVLSPELIASIKKVKLQFDKDGYSVNRLNNYCGTWLKHSGWYPDKKFRLWDTSKGQWQGINPHDEFVMKTGAVTGHLDGDLLHYSVADFAAHLKQINYFTTIAAEAYFRKGKRAGLVQLLLSPWAKFMRDYFIKLGVLDGWAGFQVCLASAFATFSKYAKLRELQKKEVTPK